MANKEISKGHEARLKIKAGLDKACDAVRPTLGAVGMTAIIEFPGLDPIECDDGVTILKNIELEDHYENIGVNLLRKGAVRTSTEGGDGTATTTVLTQALVSEAFRAIANDSSQIRQTRERLANGLEQTLNILKENKREVTQEDIEQIATISSLDPEVAKLIAEVIKEIGINGKVSVEKGSQLGYSKEVVKGAFFDKGFISPYFITDKSTNSSVLEDPYIVIVDRKISTNDQILSLLNSIGTGKSILFIADEVDSVALATLAQNAVNGIARIACVRNPYSASRAKEFLFDIAALTGGTVISEEKGMRLDMATAELCGRAEKVVVTKDSTMIIGGKAALSVLDERITNIQSSIAATTSEYEKSMLEERLAALTGGIGVIRVGAYTDTEFNAKKYKFANAINSTQAALQEGIVAGGGVALAVASLDVEDEIFRKALIAPLAQQAVNAGLESFKVVNDIKMAAVSSSGSRGMDFKKCEYVNMFDAGIIDPYKVVRLALESAVAITTALISAETAIVIKDADNKDKN